MRLPGHLLNKIADQMMDHFMTVPERQTIIVMALREKNSIFDIELEGSPRVFTMRLIAILNRDDLVAVLRELDRYSGIERQIEIDNLCKQLEKFPRDDSSFIDINRLKNSLITLFSKAELGDLCFDIQQRLLRNGVSVTIGLEEIGADGSISSIVQNLILFMQRRDLLKWLVEGVKAARPHADVYISQTEE